MHLHFNTYFLYKLYGNTAKLLNSVLARRSRNLSYLRWRSFFALLWPYSSAFGGSSRMFNIDWYDVLSNNIKKEKVLLLYTVYVTSGFGDLWFEVFFSPFFQPNLDPFSRRLNQEALLNQSFEQILQTLKQVCVCTLGAQFASCLIHWSAVNQCSLPMTWGVMQAPSAVESEMSCWPVYICLCSNYCILKYGSIQQRKGTQWTQCIAARLIKTALNIKLKNKTLKDIELAP